MNTKKEMILETVKEILDNYSNEEISRFIFSITSNDTGEVRETYCDFEVDLASGH